MKKSDYQPLICGDCDLEFLIPKKQYNPEDSYDCPICVRGSSRIVTPEDLQPVKKFGQQKKVQPYIPEKED